jgi:hypothetical protein
MGEVRHEKDRLTDGLNGPVGKMGVYGQVFIWEKDSERREKRKLLGGGEKRTPLLVESCTYY